MDYTNISEDGESLEYLLYILICNDKVLIISLLYTKSKYYF